MRRLIFSLFLTTSICNQEALQIKEKAFTEGIVKKRHGLYHRLFANSKIKDRISRMRPEKFTKGSTLKPKPSKIHSAKVVSLAKKCGNMAGRTRIIGGVAVLQRKWPWIALIYETFFLAEKLKCSGSLISRRHVLTAAHCKPNNYYFKLRVTLGEYDLTKSKTLRPILNVKVKEILTHSKYNPKTLAFDIALLKFDSEIMKHPFINPICLPSQIDPLFGRIGTVIGWGKTEKEERPSKLHEIQVPVISDALCKKWYNESTEIFLSSPEQFCAGYEEGQKDSCAGDSGGPLMFLNPNDKSWRIGGIVSDGIGCGEPKKPGLYTNVSHFLEWIRKNIKL